MNKELDTKIRDHEKELEMVADEWRDEVAEARAQVEELKDVRICPSFHTLPEVALESADIRYSRVENKTSRNFVKLSLIVKRNLPLPMIESLSYTLHRGRRMINWKSLFRILIGITPKRMRIS